MGFSPARPVQDCDYLLGRAEAELQMAESAADERAAEAHHALASAYLGRVFAEDAEHISDLWRRLHAEREKRQALKSIFTGESARLSIDPEARDDDLADLLDRLARAAEPVD